MLWILHLGYACIPIGLTLKLAAELGFGWGSGWLHAITVGAFTTMISAVSSRAALGHTGRPLIAAKPKIVAFVLISVAAVLRVIVTSVPASLLVLTLAGSAAAWIAAFVLWLVGLRPILWQRRMDSHAGYSARQREA